VTDHWQSTSGPLVLDHHLLATSWPLAVHETDEQNSGGLLRSTLGDCWWTTIFIFFGLWLYQTADTRDIGWQSKKNMPLECYIWPSVLIANISVSASWIFYQTKQGLPCCSLISCLPAFYLVVVVDIWFGIKLNLNKIKEILKCFAKLWGKISQQRLMKSTPKWFCSLQENVRKAGAEMGKIWNVCRTLGHNVSATAYPMNPKPGLLPSGECLLYGVLDVAIAQNAEMPSKVEKCTEGRCKNGWNVKCLPNFAA
jgi:hypothetical protein